MQKINTRGQNFVRFVRERLLRRLTVCLLENQAQDSSVRRMSHFQWDVGERGGQGDRIPGEQGAGEGRGTGGKREL